MTRPSNIADELPLFDQLIRSLTILPGIGKKSAQRIALTLLGKKREQALALAETLTDAMTNIGHCDQCFTYTEHDKCQICLDQRRDASLLCIVSSPADVCVIEESSSFKGRYFVLKGQLSPLDGIGPDEIGIPQLKQRLNDPALKELILATSATIEGETTAGLIKEISKHLPLTCSRIAQGIPMGGELEYFDSNTLSRALKDRVLFQ